MSRAPSTSLTHRIGLLVLLWFAGLYLRIPILVAPALAPAIDAELGLGPALLGTLTTLPVLMLAAGAVAGSLAVARLGARNAVILALAVTAAASAARGLAPPLSLLLAATAVTGLGIAVMQPALPALVMRWCPGFAALAVAVYMNGMLLGEFVGAGLTLPLVLPLAGGDWRVALLLWSLPALVVAGALYLPRDRVPGGEKPGAWQPAWRDGRMWRLGLLQGAASVVFFGTNAYMAEILGARGEGELLSRSLLWFNLSQGAASLCLLGLVRRLVARRVPLLAAAAAAPLSLAGFLLLDGAAAMVAAFVLGFASAAQLILLVALVPCLAPPGEAGRLSAGMFAIGYTIAFAVPLLGGLLVDLGGSAATALLPPLLFAAAAVLLVPGLRLDRD